LRHARPSQARCACGQAGVWIRGVKAVSAESPQQDEEQNKGKRFRVGAVNKVLHEFGPYLTIGMQLAAAVLLFFFVGYFIDKRYGTEPTFMIIGLALGTVGGFIKFFKSISELQKKDEPPKS
jgi:F0F1-type ATP synthase assembly protein I